MLKDENNDVDMIKDVNFNGAVIIDQFGREVVIAEEMIESAFSHIKDSIFKSHQ
jgi:hypothetical protein